MLSASFIVVCLLHVASTTQETPIDACSLLSGAGNVLGAGCTCEVNSTAGWIATMACSLSTPAISLSDFTFPVVVSTFRTTVDPCGSPASVTSEISIDLPGSTSDAGLATLINAAVSAANQQTAGQLTFDQSTNKISVSETVTASEEKTISVPVYQISGPSLSTISFNPKVAMSLEFKVKSELTGGKGSFEVDVDLCVEISGVSASVDIKKCGADLPTCSPWPTYALQNIFSKSFEDAACYFIAAGCNNGYSLAGDDLSCTTKRSLKELFGNPPFKITGDSLTVDFSSICPAGSLGPSAIAGLEGLGPGAIAGIVIGVIVVIGLLAFAGWIYNRKKKMGVKGTTV